MKLSFFLALSLALSASSVQLSPVEHQFRPDCGKQCKFILCKPNGLDEPTPFPPRILLRDPIAFPPFVCRKDISLESVLATGEAKVRPAKSKGKFTPISKYNPKGLSPKYPKNYFVATQAIDFPPLPGKQGISRQSNEGNQDENINNLCVLLPITRYSFKKGTKIRTRKGKKNDCVAFISIAPKLLIEFTWDSGDDFDLEVKEPSGFKISRRKPRSPSGRLLGDNNIGLCDVTDNGKEQVRYLRNEGFAGGEYTVTVKHANNCGKGPTEYKVYVIKEGSVVVSRSGTSNKDGGARVLSFKFTVDD